MSVNYVKNGSFEQGLAYWNFWYTYNSSLVSVVSGGRVGIYCLSLRTSADWRWNDTGVLQYLSSPYLYGWMFACHFKIPQFPTDMIFAVGDLTIHLIPQSNGLLVVYPGGTKLFGYTAQFNNVWHYLQIFKLKDSNLISIFIDGQKYAIIGVKVSYYIPATSVRLAIHWDWKNARVAYYDGVALYSR